MGKALPLPAFPLGLDRVGRRARGGELDGQHGAVFDHGLEAVSAVDGCPAGRRALPSSVTQDVLKARGRHGDGDVSRTSLDVALRRMEAYPEGRLL